MNLRLLEDLLLQMGFTSEDFNSIRRAQTRVEAVQGLESLKARFKVAFRKKVIELHPNHTGGDRAKSEQLLQLLEFARNSDTSRGGTSGVDPRGYLGIQVS